MCIRDSAKAAAVGVHHLIRNQLKRFARSEDAENGMRAADPWSVVGSDGFVLSSTAWARSQNVLVDGDKRSVGLNWSAGGPVVVLEGRDFPMDQVGRWYPYGHDSKIDSEVRAIERDNRVFVIRNGRQTEVRAFDPLDVDLDHLDGGGSVKAPMHGKVVQVFVEPGQQVAKGDRIAVIEAMKMEHTLVAPSDGTVTMVAVLAGEQVAEGAPVASIEAAEAQAA